MSYFYESRSGEPFVFAEGHWRLHCNAPTNCGSASGPRVSIDRDATLALPLSPTDPIPTVTGTGFESSRGGACAASGHSFDLRFTRIGD